MLSIGLFLLVLEVLFLAVPLCVVGYGVSKMLRILRESRRAQQMQAEGLVAAARARALARSRARA